jgi:hypothetical protein
VVDERRINAQNNSDPHPALLGLLRMLPNDRAPIPEAEKEEFVTLFRAVLNYVHPSA